MQYVLVNKYDEIVTTVVLESEVGISGATTYFQGVKQMPDRKSFNSLWKVMTRDDYDTQFKAGNRKPSSQGYNWWEEDKAITDDEMSLFERKRRAGPSKL